MSIRLVNPVFSSVSRLRVSDPDARAYLAAVEIADNTPLEPAVRKAVDDFVLGCKADGIWSAMKCVGINAIAKTLAGNFIPLVGPVPTNEGFVLGDYQRKNGFLGSGTKAIDTNYAGTNQTRDNVHMACYVSNLVPTLDGGYMGTTSNQMYFASNTSFSHFRARFSTSAISSNLGTTAGAKFIGASRASSVGYDWVYGVDSGNLVAASNIGPIAFTYKVHRVDTRYCLSRIGFYSIGDAINLVLLRNRVDALFAAIGAAIP